ncbi:glycosyltransferase family 2 protein [Pseudomonadota bacterium]
MEKRTYISRSLIIPVFKNEGSLPALLKAISGLAENKQSEFEVIFIVDGSPDKSLVTIIANIEQLPYMARVVSLSRNFGAFSALRTGLELAQGDHCAVMAADLQEPIKLIEDMYLALEANQADVVFGQRLGRQDDKFRSLFSGIFWSIYKRYILQDIPTGGVDVFACNKKVKTAVLSIKEPNSSLVVQLFWVGFRRLFIPYERRRRYEGKSSWSFSRRFRYMLDSIISFSDLPIILIMVLGLIGVSLSIIVGLVTIVGKLLGFIDEPGYTTTTLLLVFFGSTILSTQGILGSYLWRTYENTKNRPITVIDDIFSNKIYLETKKLNDE